MKTLESAMPLPSAASPKMAEWCFLFLEHLEEFAKLAWYLVADSNLVEETFSRTMIELDATHLDSSIPHLAYNQAREILIAQAIVVLAETRREEEENGCRLPTSLCELPDLPRLAFILRLIIRSSEMQVATFLDVTPSRVRELVRHAINHLGASMPISGPRFYQDA
jgi:DNA-directed RNA polymerase specialized sigma24 family protein